MAARRLGAAFFEISGKVDTAKLTREVGAPIKAAGDKAGRTFAGAFNAGSVAGGILAAGILQSAAQRVTQFVSSSIKAASDLQQAMGGVQSTFKTSANVIDDFGDRSAKAVGLSKAAFSSLAAPLGAALKLAGFSLDEVADKTIILTKRAADMAATFGGTTQDALIAIQAALRGESDPIERFGVGLSEARVQAEALANTGKKTASALTDQEKATARLNLILKQTVDTEGQFTREQHSAAGAAQIATAQIEDAKAKMAAGFLPVVAKSAAALGSLAEGFAQLPAPAKSATIAVTALGVATLVLVPRIAAAKVALTELGITSTLTGLRLKAMLPTLGALGVAFAAVTVLADPLQREVDSVAKSNIRLGETAGDAAKQLEVMRAMDDKLVRQFEAGGPEREKAADDIRRMMEAQGLSNEQIGRAFPRYATLAGLVSKTTGAMDALADATSQATAAMHKQLTEALGLEDAQDAATLAVLNLREQIAAQKEANEEGAGAFTGNTKAALANREAVRGIIDRYAELAAQNAKVGKSNETLRADLLKTLMSLGLNRQEAQRYADALGDIPATVSTVVYLKQISRATQLARQTGAGRFAQGGLVKFFQGGGIEDHVAQIAPRGMVRVWNEPEAAPEAYIPMAPSKRARSTAILAEVADAFGLTLSSRAGAGGGGGVSSLVRPDREIATLLKLLIREVRQLPRGFGDEINGSMSLAHQIGRAR